MRSPLLRPAASRSCTAPAAAASGWPTSRASAWPWRGAPTPSSTWTPISPTTRPTCRACSKSSPTNDLALGSRYVAGGRIDDTWGLRRFLLSRSANAYARTILGLATRDVTGGFRAWRRSALEVVDLGRIRANGYLFMVEMIYLSERLGLRIAELPIYFADRRVGDSKMSLKVKLEAAAGIAGVWRRHHRVRPAG